MEFQLKIRFPTLIEINEWATMQTLQSMIVEDEKGAAAAVFH